MEPLRVLHSAGGMNAGGAETLIMSVYREIDRSKVQFDFLYPENEVEYFYDREIEELGGRFVRVSTSRKHPLYSQKKLEYAMRENGYKVFHQHLGEFNSAMGLSAARKAEVPVRILHANNVEGPVSQGAMARLNRLFHYFNRRFRQREITDRFACSPEAARWFGFRDGSWQLVMNGIDMDRFAFSKEKRCVIRNALGIGEATFCVGQVGRLTAQKNYPFTLRAFRSLLCRRPESVLFLIGIGSLEDELKDMASSLGISEQVRFLGDRSDIDALLSGFDVFLMPSLFEGLGIALVEAQACGVQCVASDKIPSLAFASSHTLKLSIDEGVGSWVDALENFPIGKRWPDAHEHVEAAGFDIRTTAKLLEEFYLASAGYAEQREVRE